MAQLLENKKFRGDNFMAQLLENKKFRGDNFQTQIPHRVF